MSPSLSLAPGEVHLWIADYERIDDDHLHCAYRALLSAAERKQEPRFHFLRDRRRYLVTRALVRTVLSRYAPVAARDWTFVTNAYGRPHAMEATQAQLSFNVSHTSGLIALGVTKASELGVDIENFRAREVSIDIARHFFSPQETADLAATPAHLRQYRFFEYWTFKEAYIKARGMGLHLPLDKFAFCYPDDGAVVITIDPELEDDAGRWKFWQCRPRSDCLLAVCASRVDAHIADPVIRQVVPMAGETLLNVEYTRTSNERSL